MAYGKDHLDSRGFKKKLPQHKNPIKIKGNQTPAITAKTLKSTTTVKQKGSSGLSSQHRDEMGRFD